MRPYWQLAGFVIVVAAVVTLIAQPVPEADPALQAGADNPAPQRGLLESIATETTRPGLSGSSQLGFLPERGGFVFPAPYNTQAIRITNADDCGGGDCVNYVGYSYWANINNHVGQNSFYVFLGLQREQGGNGPNLWEVDKRTLAVTNLGPLFSGNDSLSYATGEGWYFSGTMATRIYVPMETQLRRYDILTKKYVVVVDVSDSDKAGRGSTLWQASSSANDQVHAMTIRRLSDYQATACAVFWEQTGEFRSWPVSSNFDECHVDQSGHWLNIIDDVVADQDGLDNRIIDLSTLAERIISDKQGAGGHAGYGYGGVVQADNWSAPSAYRYFDYNQDPLEGKLVFLLYNRDSGSEEWGYDAPAHVSFLNARPVTEVPIKDQYVCGAAASTASGPYATEVICFRLREVRYTLDENGRFNISQDNAVLVVAPTMTDMNSGGGRSGEYGLTPKGNLDVTGEYFIWTTNTGGANGDSRLDAFIVKIPAHRFQEGD